MNENYKKIEEFLNNPQKIDDIYESEAVTWIDWREYDEDIVKYFDSQIDNKIEIEFKNNKKDDGDDIILKYNGKSLMIPYKKDMERDMIITGINEIIKPDYEIRLFMESIGNDTLGFLILEKDLWEGLDIRFGKEVLEYYFLPIEAGMKMFSLDFFEVGEILELRENNKYVSSIVFMKFTDILTKEKIIAAQRQNGEIDIKTYSEIKKELQYQKEKLVKDNKLIISI